MFSEILFGFELGDLDVEGGRGAGLLGVREEKRRVERQ